MPSSPLRPLVVTGCARSGTAYTAEVVGGLGLRFGHEVVFGPRTTRFEGWDGRHGDSSWQAAPFLAQVPEAIVLHQLRHPLRVVRSLSGVRFLADHHRSALVADQMFAETKWAVRRPLMARGYVEQSTKGPRPTQAFLTFLDAHAPQVWSWPTPVERSLAFWLEWTKLIRRHRDEERYLVRHIERTDEDTLVEVLGRIGLPTTREHVGLVMSLVPKDTNTRVVDHLDWSDIPASTLKTEAEELAAELGYDVKDPARTPRDVD